MLGFLKIIEFFGTKNSSLTIKHVHDKIIKNDMWKIILVSSTGKILILDQQQEFMLSTKMSLL